MTGEICWVVTDGTPGMENQCLGLAEAMGLQPEIKRVALRAPWRQLSPYLRMGLRHATIGDTIAPPWPDIAISSGRQSIPAALAIRRQSRGHSFVVQIQDPVISVDHFDLVVVPRHDRVRGANVLTTRGGLHRMTHQRLAAEAERFAAGLERLPRPRVAVLIGGDNAVYSLSAERMETLAEQLADLTQRDGAGLMITPSRRTGARNEDILRRRLDGLPAEIWDGTGANPLFRLSRACRRDPGYRRQRQHGLGGGLYGQARAHRRPGRRFAEIHGVPRPASPRRHHPAVHRTAGTLDLSAP